MWGSPFISPARYRAVGHLISRGPSTCTGVKNPRAIFNPAPIFLPGTCLHHDFTNTERGLDYLNNLNNNDLTGTLKDLGTKEETGDITLDDLGPVRQTGIVKEMATVLSDLS